MKFSKIEARAASRLGSRLAYKYCYYLEFDFSILDNILSRKKNGSRSGKTYSESYIMFDTETSKDHEPERGAFGRWKPQPNHICAWSIAIRAFHTDICTLRGSRPSELMHCISLIRQHIKADIIYIFAHNLPYDWQFCRRFFITQFGAPTKQLNVKNHYPLTINFANGMILRDSLILAGMSLERWAKNLGVQEKAVGSWDYDLIRNQNHLYTDDELRYIECDVIAGVQCLNKLADILGDTLVSLPFTNTGIVRRIVRRDGKKNYAKAAFSKMVGDYYEYHYLESIFHGGFTHSNRYKNGFITKGVTCMDFKSSYPYCMLVTKMPCSAFMPVTRNMSPDEIYDKADKNAYIFKLVLTNVRLIDHHYPMPPLQYSKCETIINCTKDNGRILTADYCEIRLNEIDLKLIYDYYTWDAAICTDIYVAGKDYLPTWYRDIVWDIFKQKCKLEYDIKIKGEGEISMYNQIKSRLNSLYGLTVTKACKETIIECYEDTESQINGEYYIDNTDMENEYNKYLKNRNEILPYCWGCWVTSAAMYNLFQLAKCIGDSDKDLFLHWIYSDTDSIYSDKWNPQKLDEYNENVKNTLINAGYGGVTVEDKTYWLGVAENDGFYDEYISQGAKRYAYKKDGKIGITVAGVPKKKGAAALTSLEDFQDGFIFPGEITGKVLHTYIYDEIHIDDHGNEVADSIDLSPTDYTLSTVENPLKLDQLIMFGEDGELIINDTETVYYDWFEES